MSPLAGSLATVMGIWLLTVVTPGPNFFAVTHTALRGGRHAGLCVALGVTIGTAIWAAASLAGLGLLFAAAGWLYTLVKLAAAGYLIWIGARMLFAAASRASGAGPDARQGDRWKAFRFGLVTDLANPKAAAFFTSLFAVAVLPDAPLWLRAAVVVATVLIAGTWYGLAASCAALPPFASAFRRAERIMVRVTGALFVGFGAKLALAR